MTDPKGKLERERFEAWAKQEGIELAHWMPGQPECGYSNPRVNDHWFGWQAASADRAELLEALKEISYQLSADAESGEPSFMKNIRALITKHSGATP